MLEGSRTTRRALERTVRLVASARLRPPVLGALAPPGGLTDLEEIEGATSGRLNGQWRGTEGVEAGEFVYGAPCASFINAAFAYPKPGRINRFNGERRGAWYASLDVETSLAEVAFHITQELAKIGVFETRVEFAELHASFAGEAIDLLATPQHPSLHPDPNLGYPAGNALAMEALREGIQIIRYPSVRHDGGICIAALAPHAVQSVQQGGLWEMVWAGSPSPIVRQKAPS